MLNFWPAKKLTQNKQKEEEPYDSSLKNARAVRIAACRPVGPATISCVSLMSHHG